MWLTCYTDPTTTTATPSLLCLPLLRRHCSAFTCAAPAPPTARRNRHCSAAVTAAAGRTRLKGGGEGACAMHAQRMRSPGGALGALPGRKLVPADGPRPAPSRGGGGGAGRRLQRLRRGQTCRGGRCLGGLRVQLSIARMPGVSGTVLILKGAGETFGGGAGAVGSGAYPLQPRAVTARSAGSKQRAPDHCCQLPIGCGQSTAGSGRALATRTAKDRA